MKNHAFVSEKEAPTPPFTLCPKCSLEGKQATLVENSILKRCVRCLTDYKLPIKTGEIQQPVRGLKAILG